MMTFMSSRTSSPALKSPWGDGLAAGFKPEKHLQCAESSHLLIVGGGIDSNSAIILINLYLNLIEIVQQLSSVPIPLLDFYPQPLLGGSWTVRFSSARNTRTREETLFC